MTAPAMKFEPVLTRSFLREVMERSGQNLPACYQCRRCAAGCPVAQESGFVTPDRLIRMVVMGDKQGALDNELVWRCVSCYTCGVRCPNDIQTSRITETLKQMAKEQGVHARRPKVKHFHDSFVGSAVRWGRVNELEFMGFYEMKNALNEIKSGRVKAIFDEALSQMKFALPMIKKGRMHVGFQTAKGRSEVKRLMKRAKTRSGKRADE